MSNSSDLWNNTTYSTDHTPAACSVFISYATPLVVISPREQLQSERTSEVSLWSNTAHGSFLWPGKLGPNPQLSPATWTVGENAMRSLHKWKTRPTRWYCCRNKHLWCVCSFCGIQSKAAIKTAATFASFGKHAHTDKHNTQVTS